MPPIKNKTTKQKKPHRNPNPKPPPKVSVGGGLTGRCFPSSSGAPGRVGGGERLSCLLLELWVGWGLWWSGRGGWAFKPGAAAGRRISVGGGAASASEEPRRRKRRRRRRGGSGTDGPGGKAGVEAAPCLGLHSLSCLGPPRFSTRKTS